jgi:TPP-dependent pyruvate/acetoin dehydrogenase alpha subunit
VGDREDNDVGVARKEGLVEWKKRDPIGRLARAMIAAGHLAETQLERITAEYRDAVEAAWAQASADPYPANETLFSRVYAPNPA